MPLTGFRALDRRLKDIDMTRALQPSLEEQAQRLEFEIEQEAPVRTGELRDSFEVTLSDSNQDRLLVKIESDADHAVYVVRGTRYQEANNFVDRAFRRVEDELIDNIKEDTLDYLSNQIKAKR